LESCKDALKRRIGAAPIAEGRWGLQYLEKIEDLGTGRHLVKETDIIFSPQHDFYYRIPSGPF
jgi:hypothetical protein